MSGMDVVAALREHGRGTVDSVAAGNLLARFSTSDLCSALTSVLRSGDEEAIRGVYLVIRNAAALAPGHPKHDSFIAGLRQWRVIEQLEAVLFRDDHFLRGMAVYTLGKINASESAPTLVRAFSLYRDSDPLLVPELLVEIAWLGADIGTLFDSALDSPVYVTRWSIIQQLARSTDDPVRQAEQTARLARLARDENPLVRGEASQVYAALTGTQHSNQASHVPAWRQQSPYRTALPSFGDCAIWFSNYLVQAGYRTYTVRELEAFIAGLLMAPPAYTQPDSEIPPANTMPLQATD